MPEGPEVYSIAEILASRELQQVLTNIDFDEKAHYEIKAPLALPASLIFCFSHGKKLILGTETFYIIFSLGMTGAFTYENKKHVRCTMHFTDHLLYFEDVRNFGSIEIVSYEQLCERLNLLGPHLTELCLLHELDCATFCERLLQKPYLKRKIVENLLDQNLYSGIGNYLRSEILYIAAIHPLQETGTLTSAELVRLWSAIYHVITLAVCQGGFTIKNFYLPNGKQGSYQPYIYARTVDAEGFHVTKMTYKARAVYFVPEKQIEH